MSDEQKDREISAGSLDAAAIGIHEMFMSYMRAGFNADQALQLVMCHIKSLSPPKE
jgi:hypothetical protein